MVLIMSKKILKRIYLASYKAHHPNYNIFYQDILGNRDIGGNMMDVDLTKFDYIIATLPCNYYSIANYRRNTSEYSLKTKHLLPDILNILVKLNKPFIVENVKNKPLMKDFYNIAPYVYQYNRHTYWSNILLDFTGVKQINEQIQSKDKKNRQGGENDFNVVEKFLKTIHKRSENDKT